MKIITNAWETDIMFSLYKDDKDLLVHANKHISGWNCDYFPDSALTGG